jgi:hypothetical protein
VDPTGDTFGVGVPQLDITTYAGDGLGKPGHVVFTVNFAGPISPASAFAANSVVGFIDLDTDRNPATGGNAPWGGNLTGGNNWINFFVPPNPGAPAVPLPLIAMGDEFFIDLGSEQSHPGLVDVVSTATNTPTGQAPITFGSNSFSIDVLLSLLPGANGPINFDILVGTFNEPTDRAPNGATPASTLVPEPGSVLLMGLALAGLAGRRYYRRRK